MGGALGEYGRGLRTMASVGGWSNRREFQAASSEPLPSKFGRRAEMCGRPGLRRGTRCHDDLRGLRSI